MGFNDKEGINMKHNNIHLGLIPLFLVCALLLCGCSSESGSLDWTLQWSASEDESPILIEEDESYDKAAESAYVFEDSESVYESFPEHSASGDLRVLYLTVGAGTNGRNTRHTWTEINQHPLSYYDEKGIEPYQCEGVLQIGNEDGPTSDGFGYNDVTSNVIVRLRGATASTKPQKSYRITTIDTNKQVDGLKTFVLSKSYNDPYRYMNELCYELMEDIPEMFSTRTSLVHLYVKDKSEGGEDQLFRDYGLYTMIEPINMNYLKKRGLDNSGNLYKAENFDFGRHEDVIRQATDADFDQDAFDAILESKGANDHSKLISMLEAVNSDTPIEEVIDEWFYADNLYYFLAFHLLVGNRDTASSDFYLYSPNGIERFYFLSANNEAALRDDYKYNIKKDTRADYESGLLMHTTSVLFSKIFKDEECLTELESAMDDLYDNYLTEDVINEKAQELAAETKPLLYSLPDVTYARAAKKDYDGLTAGLHTQIEENFYAFYESQELPWPFTINAPEAVGGELRITWGESYSLADDVLYNVEISDSWDFKNRIAYRTNVSDTDVTFELPEPGQYFLRVTAKNENGTMQAFNTYRTETKLDIYGVLCFYINDEGEVLVYGGE